MTFLACDVIVKRSTEICFGPPVSRFTLHDSPVNCSSFEEAPTVPPFLQTEWAYSIHSVHGIYSSNGTKHEDHCCNLLLDVAAAVNARDIGANVVLTSRVCPSVVPDSCLVSFQKKASKYATGGRGRTTLTGVPGCQYLCIQDDSCTSVDVVGTSSCFLHHREITDEDLFTQTGVDHYRPAFLCPTTPGVTTTNYTNTSTTTISICNNKHANNLGTGVTTTNYTNTSTTTISICNNKHANNLGTGLTTTNNTNTSTTTISAAPIIVHAKEKRRSYLWWIIVALIVALCILMIITIMSVCFAYRPDTNGASRRRNTEVGEGTQKEAKEHRRRRRNTGGGEGTQKEAKEHSRRRRNTEGGEGTQEEAKEHRRRRRNTEGGEGTQKEAKEHRRRQRNTEGGEGTQKEAKEHRRWRRNTGEGEGKQKEAKEHRRRRRNTGRGEGTQKEAKEYRRRRRNTEVDEILPDFIQKLVY
ncbi:hypothetical protein LSAT2_031575 [Lamellibrachia satsuma]|nr:hypothetical protein LSAT2_031575 [Lamellibrachia satsuma]